MKIEVLINKRGKIIRDELFETSLQDVCENFPFNGMVGMIIDGEYAVVEFDIFAETYEFKKTTREEAELNALA